MPHRRTVREADHASEEARQLALWHYDFEVYERCIEELGNRGWGVWGNSRHEPEKELEMLGSMMRFLHPPIAMVPHIPGAEVRCRLFLHTLKEVNDMPVAGSHDISVALYTASRGTP